MSRNFYKNSDIAPPFYAGRGLRDIFGGGNDAPAAPDYTPVKEASDEAARLGNELGHAQIDEGRRQFNENMAVAKPIIAAQTRTMNQTADQGQDYYNYGRSFRPAEQAMLASSFGINPEDVVKVQGMRKAAEDTARAATEAKKKAATRSSRVEPPPVVAAAATDTRSQTPGGGLILFEGKAYTPTEVAQMLDANPNSAGLADIRARNLFDPVQRSTLGIDKMLALEDAANAAGYTYQYRKGITTGAQPAARTVATQGTTSEVKRSDGFPMEGATSDGVNPDYSAADAYQTRVLMEAAAAKRAREQGTLDEQARMDAADRAAIDAYMSGQEIKDEATRARIQALIEASDSAIYDQNKGDIEANVGRAMADARSGYAGGVNQAIRQGMRYGFSPDRLSKIAGTTALGEASQVASAANATRDTGIANTRNRLVTGATTARGMQKEDSAYGLGRLTVKKDARQSDFARSRNFGLQDDSIDWGRKMDVVGMSRGMPGASTGAYSVSTNAGNSAVQNQMAPGRDFTAALNAGTGTIMQGQGMKVQGATNLAGLQTNAYNSAQQADATSSAGFGQILGTAAGIGLKKWIV